MLILAQKGTQILLDRGVIKESQIHLYEYGFELLISTVITVASIILVGAAWGELPCIMIFLLFFIPIRIVAGGYHAKSYGKCFVWTNLIAIICVWGSRLLYYIKFPFVFLMFLWGGAYIYIWRNAPIIPAQYRGKTRREEINRKHSHKVLKAEIIVILVLSVFNHALMYTAICTSIIVALMMAISKGGEKHG